MFCPNCGNQLSDDAKFCASCGTPVALINNVHTTPAIEPAPSVEPAPSIQSVSVEPVNTAGETVPVMSTFVPEPAVDSIPAAGIGNNIPGANQYNVNQQMYAAGGADATQPVYQNPMGMSPDNSQNWGPLMPPKKKSKAPIIITLSVIAFLIIVAVVVCCLVFCGKKGGSSSAKDALYATIDAVADNDSDAAIDTLYPLYGKVFEELVGTKAESYRSLMIEDFMDDMNPVGAKFTYSNISIESKEEADSDDLNEFSTLYDSLKSQLSSYDIDLGDKEDYEIDAAVQYEGSLIIKYDGDSEKCYFDASIVKCDGKWYIIELQIY